MALKLYVAHRARRTAPHRRSTKPLLGTAHDAPPSSQRSTATTRRCSVLGLGQVELDEDVAHVLLHGPFGDHQPAAMAGLDRPSAISPNACAHGATAVQWVPPPAPGHELSDDLRVEHGAAAPDPPSSSDELTHVRDPVFQEVPDAGRRPRAPGDQLGGVALLHVLGQDEDADRGPPRSDGSRHHGAQAVIGVGRRHPHIDGCTMSGWLTFDDDRSTKSASPHTVATISSPASARDPGRTDRAAAR